MTQDTISQIKTLLPSTQIQVNVPLAPLTYFKIGGTADVFVELDDADLIARIVRFCHQEKISLTVLGGASNIVVPDEGIRGVVLRVRNEEYQLSPNDVRTIQALTLVRAGAGWKTALLVRKTVDDGLTGLEKFLGVPGTLGGAVYNNSHYLSDLIGEHIVRVQVVTPEGNIRWLSHTECEFAYDSSRFHHSGEIIVTVEFALEKGETQVSEQLIREATLYRAQTQPLGQPSSGCYFRNTPNTPELKKRFPQFADRRELPAGFLIEQAGLKGKRIGDVQVSEKHASFLINLGGGSSDQVQELAEIVKRTVKEKFGVELLPEVFWLGGE